MIRCLCQQKLKDVKGRFATVCKYISLGRNALAVIIGTMIAFFMTTETSSAPFALTGTVDTGLPTVSLPPFSVVTIRNETLDFNGMLENVGPGFIAISLIGIIEVVAVSKAFGNFFLPFKRIGQCKDDEYFSKQPTVVL